MFILFITFTVNQILWLLVCLLIYKKGKFWGLREAAKMFSNIVRAGKFEVKGDIYRIVKEE